MDSEHIPRGLATGFSERIKMIKIPCIRFPAVLPQGRSMDNDMRRIEKNTIRRSRKKMRT
jgi:hypothetical protein